MLYLHCEFVLCNKARSESDSVNWAQGRTSMGSELSDSHDVQFCATVVYIGIGLILSVYRWVHGQYCGVTVYICCSHLEEVCTKVLHNYLRLGLSRPEAPI